MTSREEVALQLTLACLSKLEITEYVESEPKNNKKYNEQIAVEAYELYNRIFKNLGEEPTTHFPE